MFRLSLWNVVAVLIGLVLPGVAAAQPRLPHIHHALHEMREAHKELKDANHNFGGHREKALEALSAAINQTEKALVAAGDPFKGFTPGKIYGDYQNHPHLRHSLVEMKAAHRELKESNLNFGGHKERALEDLNVAINQVEKCIEHAR